jgi:hypothetical protein
MIKQWFIELLAEVGVKLPEKKKKIIDIETLPDGRNLFSPDRFQNMAEWEVRWESRHGHYSGNVRSEVAAFTTRATAEAFAQTLRDAHKILRNTVEIKIKVTKVG